jgi:hypothetical protein
MARLNYHLKVCKTLTARKNYLNIYCYFEQLLPHCHLSYGHDVSLSSSTAVSLEGH